MRDTDSASEKEQSCVLAFAFSYSVLKFASSISDSIWSLLSFLATRAQAGGDLAVVTQQWMVSSRTLSMFVIGGGLLWISRRYWRGTVSLGRQRLNQFGWLLLVPVFQVGWVCLLVSSTAPAVTIGGGFHLEFSPMLIAIISSVVPAPIIEEVLFRGVLFAKLLESGWSAGGVITATSITWALGHLPNELGVLKLLMVLPLGFALGYLRLKTQGLSLPIAVHAAVNLTSALLPAVPPNRLIEWSLRMT